MQEVKRLQEIKWLPSAAERHIVLAKHSKHFPPCTVSMNMKLILRATASGVDGQPNILNAHVLFGRLEDKAPRRERCLPIGHCIRLLEGCGLNPNYTRGGNNEGMCLL